MVTVDRESDIPGAVEEFYNTFSQPVSKASKFYTLYYMDEELDLDGFGFQLHQESNSQRDAFYNYSIYACLWELTNITDFFNIDNYTWFPILSAGDVVENIEGGGYHHYPDKSEANAIANDVIQIIERNTSDGVTEKVKDIMLYKVPKVSTPLTVEQTVDFARTVGGEYNAFTEPDEFLEACEFIFGYDWENGVDWTKKGYIHIDPSKNDNAFGWRVSYGGQGWKSVATTARMRDELSSTAYIDLMWAVEHNNGNFIDKIPEVTSDELESVAQVINSEFEDGEGVKPNEFQGVTEEEVGKYYMSHLVPEILTHAREENIRPLFRLARNKYSELRSPRLREELFPQSEMIIDGEAVDLILEER